jgi:hypothetical protein
MEIRNFNPGVDKSILILMGGMMWCGVGIMLIRYAVSWLSLCSVRDQICFYSAGFLAAMPIHHFGFIKIATRNINRILSHQGKNESSCFYDLEKLSNSSCHGFIGDCTETFLLAQAIPVYSL